MFAIQKTETIKNKHWIELLPEVGNNMEKRASSIKDMHSKIQEKLKEIEILQQKIHEEERSASEFALTEWNNKEIETAKALGGDFNALISREQFMEYFRSDDFNNQVDSDDCIEVFATVMKGSSDFTVELLEEILSDYGVEHIEVHGTTCRNGRPMNECDCC
jgi:metal-responsive CopG/Arc/MetJ family transcriptional regulator